MLTVSSHICTTCVPNGMLRYLKGLIYKHFVNAFAIFIPISWNGTKMKRREKFRLFVCVCMFLFIFCSVRIDLPWILWIIRRFALDDIVRWMFLLLNVYILCVLAVGVYLCGCAVLPNLIVNMFMAAFVVFSCQKKGKKRKKQEKNSDIGYNRHHAHWQFLLRFSFYFFFFFYADIIFFYLHYIYYTTYASPHSLIHTLHRW